MFLEFSLPNFIAINKTVTKHAVRFDCRQCINPNPNPAKFELPVNILAFSALFLGVIIVTPCKQPMNRNVYNLQKYIGIQVGLRRLYVCWHDDNKLSHTRRVEGSQGQSQGQSDVI